MTSRIYFIQAGESGPIKIGVSLQVDKRLEGLRTSSPVCLRLLATKPGEQVDEWLLHKKLASHRLHGEWFDPHEDVLAEVSIALQFDQKIEKRPSMPKTPDQFARAAADEKFIRVSLIHAIRVGFAHEANPAAAVARLANVTQRAVENWLKRDATPSATAAFNFARGSFMGKVWFVNAICCGVIADRCDIDCFEAAKVLADNPILVTAIMREGEHTDVSALVTMAFRNFKAGDGRP
jgi:hypothetical protein